MWEISNQVVNHHALNFSDFALYLLHVTYDSLCLLLQSKFLVVWSVHGVSHRWTELCHVIYLWLSAFLATVHFEIFSSLSPIQRYHDALHYPGSRVQNLPAVNNFRRSSDLRTHSPSFSIASDKKRNNLFRVESPSEERTTRWQAPNDQIITFSSLLLLLPKWAFYEFRSTARGQAESGAGPSRHGLHVHFSNTDGANGRFDLANRNYFGRDVVVYALFEEWMAPVFDWELRTRKPYDFWLSAMRTKYEDLRCANEEITLRFWKLFRFITQSYESFS